jgi:hypothetical protein
MKYFETLPKIVVTENKVSKIYTNLLARTNVIQGLINNPLLFYTYDIQESDTPEIIAHKYYDDIDRYWIVLLVNQIFDPQWNWPLESRVFNEYLTSKYSSGELEDVHHYEKIFTKTDNSSDTTTTEKITIDLESYTNLLETTTTHTLPSGSVTVKTTKKIVNNYEYEVELNESKRNIKLLNTNYVQEIESELFNLMSK